MQTYSFIIPTYNEAAAIATTVSSLKRQNLGWPCRIEVIVVDDQSTDDTVALAQAAGAKVIRNDGSLPTISALRNRGAAEAQCDAVIGFVDGDMELPESWLSTVLSYLEQGIDVVGCLCEVPADAPWVARTWSEDERRRGVAVWDVDYLPGRNIVLRKTAFQAVGGFDPDLETAEDKDFTYRLRQAGYRVVQLDQPRARHLGYEPNLWVYLKKEFWRQKSAFAFAQKHHYAFRTLRHPLLSLWHLGGLLLVLGLLPFSILFAAVAGVCWILPTTLIAARATRKPLVFLRLWLLTFLRWHIAAFGLIRHLIKKGISA